MMLFRKKCKTYDLTWSFNDGFETAVENAYTFLLVCLFLDQAS